MNPAASLDLLDLPTIPSAPVAAETRAEEPRKRSSSAAGRWWFTFDGWRSADVEAEYVLA